MNDYMMESKLAVELGEIELLDIQGGKLGWNDLGFYISGVGGGVLGAAIAGAAFGSAAGPIGSFVGALIGGGVYWLLDQF
ncbi:hypothetical protein [Anaerocellum danielii]|uniref:Bacteriocin n=1 Tax=Anaerocellum danielii TaxID=1387557 RepID=A0ABZ0U2Z8_9FIRM|nr:hypothetical protein [Caldicellulosiruptor danielii]WPX10091.1 hypothetical protein SOJ16_001355 [Caldicellulosiruptor danielii]